MRVITSTDKDLALFLSTLNWLRQRIRKAVSIFMCKIKTCSKCSAELPSTSEYFYRQSDRKDGYNPKCKTCVAKRDKAYHQDNKEAILKRYNIWRKNNREHIVKTGRAYRQLNREHISKYRTKYQKENKDITSVCANRRRTKEKLLPSTLTVQQWKAIKINFNNCCSYCGKELPLEQDHFIPLSGGGEYTRDNIVPACRSCNASKCSTNPFIWYPRQSFYTRAKESKILKHLGYKQQKQQLSIF